MFFNDIYPVCRTQRQLLVFISSAYELRWQYKTCRNLDSKNYVHDMTQLHYNNVPFIAISYSYICQYKTSRNIEIPHSKTMCMAVTRFYWHNNVLYYIPCVSHNVIVLIAIVWLQLYLAIRHLLTTIQGGPPKTELFVSLSLLFLIFYDFIG